MLAGASLDAEASSSTKKSAKSSNQQITQPNAVSMSSIFCIFGFCGCNESLRARLRVLRLRVVAGLGVKSSVANSCGTDVEDVLVVELEELVDHPGTTSGTQFSVLHWLFRLFKKDVFF